MSRLSTPRASARRAAFRRKLSRWFRRHGRDLPWRRTRDPYRVLVSEVMLQQTQVSRVTAYYDRFLVRFPSLEALAAAPAAAVREAWQGLGYYRRAANLHRTAQAVVADHQAALPSSTETLRRLPGVGRYTAGAIAAFAWELPEAAVDTNVARVLRRAFHRRGTPGAARLWATARAMQPRSGGTAAWTWNQAIMELGATLCTARVAHCHRCPVRRECATGRRWKESPAA